MYATPRFLLPYTSTSVASMSIVTGPSASSAARSAGSRPVIRAVAAARPASAPRQCLAVNRRASPVAVEVASPGTGVTCCPAASARSRSRPTRKSSPASCAAAIPASTCPPVNPRRRCFTGPIASSRASIRPSLPHSSVTAIIPPAAVSDGSAAPICIRPRVLACLPDAITIPVTCFLRDSGAVTPYHPRNDTLSRGTRSGVSPIYSRIRSEDLPRHRGQGAANVQAKIHALARLSESLRARPDHGELPAALGRADIEAFLNRLGYLESAGTISRYHRNVICRGARTVLAGIRAMGLTRPGQAAAGLPGDFVVGATDIPPEPVRGEPGRDLPPEIMTVLCASLDTLQPAEVQAATQIAIDTGRRPEDILGLPLDCLARDKDGAAVLVYDNAKAHRLGRRLPVSQATATVITGQQARVRARFPGTPPAELKLLPAARRNPDGRRPMTIDMLEGRHRDWAGQLGPLRTRDGAEFNTARIVPYAYRHTYAQRHADAGVPIDVLAELLDHRNLNVTRCYYRVGEDRRREAVDKVTALSFDRHGNRIWQDAAALLESAHARYAVGEVAVPYGRCTEPSNVQAGGGACPIRFRCAGCDHFRTDVSYLPDLAAYLDDLLRTRERLAAAIDGVDEWARADATPAEEEITRIRRLIGRVKGDMTRLSDPERARIDEAVTVIRKHRAVSLGMPSVRITPPSPASEAPA